MKNLLLFTIIITTGLLSSCSDSRREGCTDPLALNYESFADYDDRSCVFEADLVFYYDNQTANELNLLGFDRLDYYIEESPGIFSWIGSEYPNPILGFIAAGAPNCYEDTYVTYPALWHTNNIEPYRYQVYGVHINVVAGVIFETETKIDEYLINLPASSCTAFPVRFLTMRGNLES